MRHVLAVRWARREFGSRSQPPPETRGCRGVKPSSTSFPIDLSLRGV